MSKQVLGNDIILGQIAGRKENLVLSKEARATHLGVFGATGTGKSKFVENMIRQDIRQWHKSKCGLLLIDPHGAIYESLMQTMASYEIKRPVIPIDLRSDDWIVAYNILRPRGVANPSVIVDNIVQAIAYVWGQSGTDHTPLFARWASDAIHALYEKKLTFVEATVLFDHKFKELRQAITSDLQHQPTRRDWEFADTLKPREFEQDISSTVNRILRFLRNDYLRCILGQGDVSLDLGRALEEGWIILVNLSREKAKISKEDADVFATLLLNDLWIAAQERGKRAGIKPFYVYLDEFQRFVTPTIAENLDEARGFGLHLTLANQFPQQLIDAGEHGKRLYNSVMENTRNKVVFELKVEENLKPLAQILFQGIMDPDEVKHKIYSTKVMEYREEYRMIYGSSKTTSVSRGTSGGSTESETWNPTTSQFEVQGTSESFGESGSESESTTESESRVPMLIPVLGKELSQIQYRSLDEQLFRAMAVLFDQQQRQCVARLVGMKAPASIITPMVKKEFADEKRIEKYINALMKQWDFAKPMKKALEHLKERERYLKKDFIQTAIDEPKTARSRITKE